MSPRRRAAAGALAGASAAVAVALLVGAAPRGDGVDLAFFVGAGGGAALAWRRALGAPLLGGAAVIAAALPLGADGLRGGLAVAALVAAVTIALYRHGRPTDAAPIAPPVVAAPGLVASIAPATALGLIAFVIYTVFALERHRRFGSGSWDYGCYVHNAWLFGTGEAFSASVRSSVLGDVAFWGGTNHFMPSLVLTAPVAWVMAATGDTSWLAVAQNLVVCATALPLALLARRRGLDPLVTTAVVAAFLFHVGTQAALLFDVHEIAPVPLLLVSAALVLESPPRVGRVVALAALLLVCAGTKESSWLYVAGFGAFMVVSGKGWRTVGVVVAALGVLGFIVVVGSIQPALIEDGAGMIHAARFVGVGDAPADGLVGAALSMLRHPGRTLAAFVTPDVKLATLVTSTAGFGHAPLASLPGLLLGAPNLVERFLSDKREMWGLAFHYGLVTAGWLAIAAVDALARWRHRLPGPVAAAVVLIGSSVSLLTSPRPPDLASLEQPYFASVDEVARYRRALATVGPDDAVVAQNHFLPHVALRSRVWLPETRFLDRADVVVLDTGASAWPHDRRHVLRLVRLLEQRPDFAVAFREATTVVFRRRVTPR